MPTPHNEAKIGEIAKTVIMPGDPLRAKYIADNFLKEAKLVNQVRNIYAYTGKYKGKEVTVMASGMGMPSIGIYSYELYKEYNVENIIRIGSCGGYIPELKIFDTILVDKTYSESNFALTMNNEDVHLVDADKMLNKKIEETAKEQHISFMKGTTLCSDCFDYYMDDIQKLFDRMPKGIEIIGAEMEAFALFYTAKVLQKKAACLLTVVDSHFYKEQASSEDREKSLNDMITLALETSLKL
ncbi:MAG: purine-nucleoside phosphorylase [Clostridia bacterium]